MCIVNFEKYIGKLSIIVKNIVERKDLNCIIAFKNVNDIRNQICKVKDPIEKLEKCGVYELSCGDCPATYVGKKQLKK